MAELDNNDKALVQYFLRGMRRFEKHVRAQDVFAVETLEAVEDAGSKFSHSFWRPVQKASALVQGIKVGLDLLRSRRRRRNSDDPREQQEEELFI